MYVCMYVSMYVFSMPRDKSTITTIRQQLFPENPKVVLEAYDMAMQDYEHEMNSKHGFLFANCTIYCGESMHMCGYPWFS